MTRVTEHRECATERRRRFRSVQAHYAFEEGGIVLLISVQITSEQLLREAQERQEPSFQAPKQRIQDQEELREFQGRKRTEFEGRIRYSRDSIIGTFSGEIRCSNTDYPAWIKYAQWEAQQNEFER